jgi:membrane dipeptidase
MYYDLGVRWMLIAYNRGNLVGGGCHDAEDKGLTKFGRNVVEEMERVGMWYAALTPAGVPVLT